MALPLARSRHLLWLDLEDASLAAEDRRSEDRFTGHRDMAMPWSFVAVSHRRNPWGLMFPKEKKTRTANSGFDHGF